MTTHFVVEVETTSPAPAPTELDAVDRWVEALKPWHGTISASPAGHLTATITLPADSLAQAIATGLLVITAHATPLAVTALPEEVRDAREGWAVVPPLMSVTEVASRLGKTRTRVQQMIDEGKLPGSRVGSTWAVPTSAVEAQLADAD